MKWFEVLIIGYPFAALFALPQFVSFAQGHSDIEFEVGGVAQLVFHDDSGEDASY